MTKCTSIVALGCLLLVAGCTRDFSEPDEGAAIVDLQVSPALVGPDTAVVIAFRVVGAIEGAPEVRLLGELLAEGNQEGDGYRYVYQPSGQEPQGVEVVVEVSVVSDGQALSSSSWVKFDFTPPAVTSVSASPLSVAAGQELTFDLMFTEDLATEPLVRLSGTQVACSTINASSSRCTHSPDGSGVPGWQVAELELEDLAGNQATLQVPLGAAFDFGGDLAFDGISSTPSPAARGMSVEIAIRSNLPLATDPAVTLAGRPVARTLGPDSNGGYVYSYFVTGTELGADPAEGEAPLSISGTSIGGSQALYSGGLLLDFRAPDVLGVQASPSEVLIDEDVSLNFNLDESTAAISASIQGRPMDCDQTGLPAETATCTYRATGTEVEGSQSVVVRPMDVLGNADAVTLDAGFRFDFTCQVDPSRVFLVLSHGRVPVFMAEPGAFEPGAILSVYDRPRGEVLAQGVVAEADGSVVSVELPSSTSNRVWYDGVDSTNRVCLLAQTGLRFKSDFFSSGSGTNPNTFKFIADAGDPRLHLLAFDSIDWETAIGVLEAPDGDQVQLEVPADKLLPSDWVNMGGSNLPWSPWDAQTAPLVYSYREQAVARWAYASSESWVHYWGGHPDEGGTGWFATAAAYEDPGGDISKKLSVEHGYGLAWDTAREELLVYAGAPDYGEAKRWLWRFDGFQFFIHESPPMPPARLSAGFAFDEARKLAFVFGGIGGPPTFDWLDDTWAWDGLEWTERDPLYHPPARAGARMVFDRKRQMSVLFGGGANSSYREDLWEWSGEEWFEKQPFLNPDGRVGHGMDYHAGRGVVMLHGGFRDPVTLGDVWTWDGHSWKTLATRTSAPALDSHGMAYDPVRGRMVIYGGYDQASNYNWDVWELTGDTFFPLLIARLVVPAVVDFSAQVRLHLRIASVGVDNSGAVISDLDVSFWDYSTQAWVLVERVPGSALGVDQPRDVQVSMNGTLFSRFNNGTILVLLAPAQSSSPAGTAKLTVDYMSLEIDAL